ncbi:Schiff base-forming aldolase, active site [Sesbania bispinosa]|nr:Schiff base-forming aldolase, active site [Sesbania bispinosa]
MAMLKGYYRTHIGSLRKQLTSIDDIRSLRLIAAVKTPYLPNGQFDLEAYDNLVNMQIANGIQVKVVGNAGSNCTAEAIKATERGFAVGMHSALHISPYYGKPPWMVWLLTITVCVSIGPVIIYNNPPRTAQDIPPSVIEILAQSPNLVGVKECSGNDRIKYYTDQGIVVWTGFDKEAMMLDGIVGLLEFSLLLAT